MWNVWKAMNKSILKYAHSLVEEIWDITRQNMKESIFACNLGEEDWKVNGEETIILRD